MPKKQMSTSLKVIIGTVLIFIVFEIALLLAVYDLEITASMYKYDTAFAEVMDTIGTLIAPLLFALSGIAIANYFTGKEDVLSNARKSRNIAMSFVFVGYAYSILVCFLISWVAGAIGLVVLTGLIAFIFKRVKKLNEAHSFVLYAIGMVCVCYCVLVLVVITGLKMVWGRVRPEDLLQIEQFTHFYVPQGYTGNFSFPSGHTSNATILFILTMTAPMIGNRFMRFLVYLTPTIWVILMAGSRVVLLKHYTSDVFFGFLISLGLYQVAKIVGGKLVERQLEKEIL